MTTNPDTTLSIIIPTRNRPKPLADCLAALAQLDYPRSQFEVVLIDDGSDEPLDAVVSGADPGLDIRLVRQERSGPAGARNAGAAKARYEFLAFTDDDCMPEPGWLRHLAAALTVEPTRMVGGRIENALVTNPFSEASQDLIAYLYSYFNETSARFFCSNNLAVSRDGFLAAGGFDTRFPKAAGEDRELCDRWHFEGRPLHYAEDAVVFHAHKLDARRFWLQHLRYGRAAAHYQRLYADRRGQSVRLEPAHFYTRLVAFPFSRLPLHRAAMCASLLAVSQIANAAGFFSESIRLRRGLTGPA